MKISALAFCIVFSSSTAFAHLLRVGTLALPDHPQTQLIVLGIEQAPNSDLSYNFNSIGFIGDVGNIDPKFLLEVDEKGVTEVRSFELGESTSRPSFPPILLTVRKAKLDEVGHYLANGALGALKTLGFPLAPIGVGVSHFAKQIENRKKFQAYYLLEWVTRALPEYDQFPELKAVLPEKFLLYLGQALLTRFNPTSNIAGLSVRGSEDGAFFAHWRQWQMQKRSENLGYLDRYADQSDLRVIFIDDSFGFVFVHARPGNRINKTSAEDHLTKFICMGSEKMTPKQVSDATITSLVKQGIKVDLNRTPLVPWCLASFVNPEGPVDLANFAFPQAYSDKLTHLTNEDLELELGGSIIPFSNLIVKLGKYIARTTTIMTEQTYFLSRLQSYASLLALTETEPYPLISTDAIDDSIENRENMTQIEKSGIVYEQMHLALQQMGVDYPFQFKSEFETEFQTENLNRIATRLAAAEMKFGRYFPAFSPSELKAFKDEHWSGLQKLLTPRHASRSPSGTFSKAPPEELQRNPMILFFVDGLRPDRFHEAVQNGHFPRLGELFAKRGVQVDSYAYRSLTLPSWSSILTGFKPDMHGIRSNTPTSRTQERVTDNYQDPRKDFLISVNRIKNRAFQRIEEDKTGEDGKVWFPAYFAKEQAVFNYLPVSNGAISIVGSGIKQLFGEIPEVINQDIFVASLIDQSSARATVKAIKKDKKGKLRLVINWYSAVDEASHINNRSLNDIYDLVDEAAGKILDAAKKHPSLKDATVFLVSDHGHTGGFGPFGDPEIDAKRRPLLTNAGFNLTEFFAGEFSGYRNYNFVVGAADSPEPKFYEYFVSKYEIQPFSYIYPKNSGPPSILVDNSGDNLAQIYVQGSPDWKRMSFAQLSQVTNHSNQNLDFIHDLLTVRLPNHKITEEKLLTQILTESDRHPVALLAMPITGELAQSSVVGLAKKYLGEAWDTTGVGAAADFRLREPILVLSLKRDGQSYKSGIIFTRSDSNGHDEYSYMVVKGFSQDLASGLIQASQTENPTNDPLNYLGQLDLARDRGLPLSAWRSDRDWLRLAKDHYYPTAIYTLSSTLTLAPKFTIPTPSLVGQTTKADRQAEIPDLVLVANRGYAFHADIPLESDHGGLAREEVKNTFIVSSLQSDRFLQHHDLDLPVFNFDFMPTFLDYAGVLELPSTQGVSFKRDIDRFE